MVASAVAMNSALPSPKVPASQRFPERCRTAGHPGQAGAGNDHDEAEQQRAFGTDPARHDDGDQHRDAHHRHLAGEQQRHLRGRCIEVVRDWLENRVDETDPHERDDRREGNGPNGFGLTPHRGGDSFSCYFVVMG